LRQFLNFDFIKDEVENVHSSSIDFRTCTIIIYANLKIPGINVLRCRKPLMFAKVASKD
jgi:hypothetical protein